MDQTGYASSSSIGGNPGIGHPTQPIRLGPPTAGTLSGLPVKPTPITGRVSRAKKGFAVHICDICKPPKTFARAEHLRRHQLSHQTPQYQCDYPGCDRAFHRPDLLARHQQKHEQEGDKASGRGGQDRRGSAQVDETTIGSSGGSGLLLGASTPVPTSDVPATPLLNPPSKHLASDLPSDALTDSGYGSLNLRRRNRAVSHNLRQMLTKPVFLGEAETPTAYSGAATLDGKLESFITDFAEELTAALPRSLSVEQLNKLTEVIPNLLKSFASKLDHASSSSSTIQRELAYIVYKYCDHITLAVVKIYAIPDEGEDEEVVQPVNDAMPIEDKISFWQSKENDQEDIVDDRTPWDDGVDAGDSTEDFIAFQEYLDTLLGSPIYEWLFNSILREIQFETTGNIGAREKIRLTILKGIGELVQQSLQVSPTVAPTVLADFKLPWISNFFPSQEYDLSAHEALPRILVLVGSGRHAWCTSCQVYVQSIWPDFGPQILDFYGSLLQKGPGAQGEITLFDLTTLRASINHDETTCTMSIYGSAYTIAEVGELLAWLHTALTLPKLGVVHTILPHFRDYTPNSLNTVNSSGTMFRFTPILRDAYFQHQCDIAGRCWMNFFHNPVLVEGYPVPQRSKANTGMEVPLNIMAELAGAHRLSRFAGKILIKGYSTILIPTQRDGDLIFWHMVYNADGTYISYSDPRVSSLARLCYPKDLSISDLEKSRHILGWCANVHNYTGSQNANYSIQWSGLQKPGPGCAFEKISIVGGMYITAGVSCILGKKDKAVHIKLRDDYTMRLKWVSKKFVLLYDVQDKRAWLVDGLSALSHLVRASLKNDQTDAFNKLLLYEDKLLQEAPAGMTGKDAAIYVLTSKQNTSIPLYAKPESVQEQSTMDESGQRTRLVSLTKTDYCLRERVESICDILEQIMAQQADVSTEDGVGFKIKYTIRRQLEGFEFMDVATDEDPFWPRVTTLRSSGSGWVDFARAIQAITLFGKGFGELIKPANEAPEACVSCHVNSGMPLGQDLLAACVPEIQEILDKRGSVATTPWRLVDDIYWHAPDKTFEPCQCSGLSLKKHDRVQVLLPATFPKLWARGLRSPVGMGSNPRGAFLFGHSWRFPLRWKNHGVPEEGEADQDMEDMEASLHNSGIDSAYSVSSVGVVDGNSVQSSSCNHPSSFNSDETPPPAKRKRLLLTDPLAADTNTAVQSTSSTSPNEDLGAAKGPHERIFHNLFSSIDRRKGKQKEQTR